MEIVKLTREMVLKHLCDLIEIDRIVKADDQWDDKSFLLELVGKWNNSLAALLSGKIIGYIICSIKNNDTLHIHRIAVKEKYQKNGIGTELIERIIKNSNNIMKYIILKVRKDNIAAQKFYEKHGFRRVYLEGNNYIYIRGNYDKENSCHGSSSG